MLKTESSVKKEAKAMLSNKSNWKNSILVTITIVSIATLLLKFLISLINLKGLILSRFLFLLFLIILSVLTIPLSLGLVRWFLKITNGASPNYSEIFYYYKSSDLFFRSLGTILIYVKTIFIPIALYIFELIILLCVINVNNINLVSLGFSRGKLFFVFFVLCSFFSAIFTLVWLLLKYFLAQYYTVMDNHTPISVCINESAKNMHGNMWPTFKLMISFFLLLISCFLIIPMFYVLPYMYTSMAIYAKRIINKDNS